MDWDKKENLFDDEDNLKEDQSDFFREDKPGETSESESVEEKPSWNILLVDDEEDVHIVTKMALSGFEYSGKEINYLDAYSAKEAIEILKKDSEIALILLDVVMETNHAGLDVTRFIREDLVNDITQIILRTGHPGMAPEKEVIMMYGINDYKTKTDMTSLKLFSSVLTSLRTYESLVRLNEMKENLEQKVRERTAELEIKNRNITHSIQYASRIQNAILPGKGICKKFFADYFILFNPKDIVSGDFYWVYQVNDRLIFTVADCTGHGVPGAFMSILSIMLLGQLTGLCDVPSADIILNNLRDRVKSALHSTGNTEDEKDVKDGLDLALCIYDPDKNILEYAGAFNPIYRIRNKSFEKLDADQMPIGPYMNDEKPFTRHEVEIKPGDVMYLFTDGFADQFGGGQNKKFTYKRFQELLMNIHSRKMAEQKKVLDETLREWQGKREQIDDITVMGIRF